MQPQTPRGPYPMLAAYRRLADRISIERLAHWLAGLRLGNAALLALIVVLATFPLLVIRSYHYEEGLTVVFAKDALQGDRWYDPSLYGFRFVERPVLQSWIVALISWPLGTVTQITARLPTIAAVFGGALLVATLLKDRASRAAVLFAALSFVFAPMVLQKIIVAESEVLLATVQFAAFVLWWDGVSKGGPSMPRWALIGILLLATASFKGPQPAAFFAVGIGAYILVRRDWAQLPGYALAGTISLGGLAAWYLSVLEPSDTGSLTHYMRLELPESLADYLGERLDFATFTVQFLPAILLAVPAAIDRWRGRGDYTSPADGNLIVALLLYGGLTLVPLALWPETQPRYAMTALLPVACLAGLAFDRALLKAIQFTRIAIGILAALAVYQMVWAWIAAPAFWPKFASSRLDANTIEAAAPDRERMIVAPVRSAEAVLAYLERPIRYLTDDQLRDVAGPVYLLGWPATAEMIGKERADLMIVERARMRDRGMVLYELSRRLPD